MQKSVHTPLISVITPCFNQARYLTEALDSVLGQTYTNWECIVVNDGSTDGTEAVALQFCHKDARIRYVRKSNGGLSSARNTGLRNTRGHWVQFLDADDILEPTKFEKHLRHIRESGSASGMVSYCDYKRGHQSNIRVEVGGYVDCHFKSRECLKELIVRWEDDLSIPAHCFLFSGVFFSHDGITFDESLSNHEDFDCWLRIFALNPRVIYIDEKLCIYRMSDGSMSCNMALMGDGFLQLIDAHLNCNSYPPSVRSLLLRKRRQVLKTYNRIDRMSLKEKLLLSGHLSRYYWKRLLQKSKLVR